MSDAIAGELVAGSGRAVARRGDAVSARRDIKGPSGLLPAYADLADPDERVPLDVDQALRDAIPKTTWDMIEWGWGRYMRWCAAVGRHHGGIDQKPPTIGTIRTYIWAHLTWTRKDGVTLAGRGGRPYAYATVETALGLVCTVLQWQGHPSPWKHPGVRAQLKAYDKKLRSMGIMPREAVALTPAEQAAMIRTRDMEQVAGIRDAAMLALHQATGVRAAELVALDETDLEWLSPTRLLVTVRVGKGGEARRIPVQADEPDEETGEMWAPDCDPTVLLGEWQDLKRSRGIPRGGPLWLECRVGRKRADGTISGTIVPGRRMTKGAYEQVHARSAHAAGVDVDADGNPRPVSTHSDRAAYITNSSDAGVPIERIRQFTGHSPNSPTIFRYVRSGQRWDGHNPMVQIRKAAIRRRLRASRSGGS